MFQEFIKAFFLIFIAEIGDKTQVMLMTFAARYSVLQVVTGIFIGVALNHGLAITIGMYLSNIIAEEMIQMFAGAVFMLFGFYSLVEHEEEKQGNLLGLGPILAVAVTFFLGELGDKTQLTAMTVAMESIHPFFVLSGSVAGMIAAGCIGIVIGTSLTKKVPSYIIKMISGIVFIAFGLFKLFSKSDLFVCNLLHQGIILTASFFVSIFFINKLLKNR